MNAKKWLNLIIYFTVLFFIIPYGLIFIYLRSNYENNTFEHIVKKQIKNNSIYGSALNGNTFSYKLELIKKVKPEIIALGSSRVMQFREDSFNKKFVNAGGGMNSLNEGLIFLKKMYEFHNPKYIILGLDFWWLNSNISIPTNFSYHKNTGNIITKQKIWRTLKWLASGKIDKNTLKNIFSKENFKNKYTNYNNMGFDAISTSDGFRIDGSRSSPKHIFGLRPNINEQFSDVFNRIESGQRKFEYGSNLSEEGIKYLKSIISFIESKGTEFIIVVPPVANSVLKKMSNYEYSYINKINHLLIGLKVEKYNYHDPSLLTTNDCEFLDGGHGGDILYKRILKDIHAKKSSLTNYLNIKKINNDIDKFKGNTLTIDNKNYYLKKEVDFLKIGCQKS